jgi:hypothetical protein
VTDTQEFFTDNELLHDPYAYLTDMREKCLVTRLHIRFEGSTT